MATEAAQAVCEYVVKQIVDDPDAVSVEASESDSGILLSYRHYWEKGTMSPMWACPALPLFVKVSRMYGVNWKE